MRRLYEFHTNQRHFERLGEVMTEDFAKTYVTAVNALISGFPDARFDVVQLVEEADTVVVRWKWSGTHTGEFRGHAPTGKKVINDGVVIYVVRDGKLVSSWTLNDRLGVLQAIGAL
ncbi:MAG: ester cyclase [Archangium sp.]